MRKGRLHVFRFRVHYDPPRARADAGRLHTLAARMSTGAAFGYATGLLGDPRAWAVDIERDGRSWAVLEDAARRPPV